MQSLLSKTLCDFYSYVSMVLLLFFLNMGILLHIFSSHCFLLSSHIFFSIIELCSPKYLILSGIIPTCPANVASLIFLSASFTFLIFIFGSLWYLFSFYTIISLFSHCACILIFLSSLYTFCFCISKIPFLFLISFFMLSPYLDLSIYYCV